ncbi:MAG TPA: transporter substrate-binding domain-containing protein [Micromonosporaceae bacterium]
MSRTLAALAAAMLASVALSGCSTGTGTGTVAADCTPRHSFHTLTKGTLTVSTYTYAPATIVKGGDLGGVEGGLLKQIAQWECVRLKILEQAPAGVIPAVQSGRADLAAGSWYRTQKRADVLNLTDPIYTDNMVFVSKDGAIGTVDDLKGKRVGTFEGNLWNADLQALLGDALKIYAGESETFRDLKAGRIDVAVDGAGGSTNMIKLLGLTGYQMATPPADPAVKATTNPGQIGWPNTKSNTALNAALNDDIAQLRSSGEVARLLKQYGYPDSAATVGPPSLL